MEFLKRMFEVTLSRASFYMFGMITSALPKNRANAEDHPNTEIGNIGHG